MAGRVTGKWTKGAALALAVAMTAGCSAQTGFGVLLGNGESTAAMSDGRPKDATTLKEQGAGQAARENAQPEDAELAAFQPKEDKEAGIADERAAAASVKLEKPTTGTTHFSAKQGDKLIALTFDDGPDHRYTPEILEILKASGAKATFFMVGTQLKKYPDTVKQIVADGHGVGNHTYHHANLAKLNENEIKQEIKTTDALFREAVGFVPHLVRAPYGSVSDVLKTVVRDNNRELVGWTVDTMDWDGATVTAMRGNVNKNARPGGIVLMHSFGSKHLRNTVKLLPLIIKDLRAKGYTFVTVDELLAAKAQNKKAAQAQGKKMG
ncbi:polysaccharide deacetylase family protein [Paenibacillus methanolicus]|uniref:Peptidoglycan/xylan/chitin deacetylase (PgdA/CDA1 family) n=1 Tax=Paenibacillus methanolicus TaxID=582686 RepID=A0A5S5BRQ8_9BACL|nr:polysaccharide deacetylase family protein [Paenibacillus methanolicus]TYP69604.1 peptidoglycan/xylan/chitin deacetylase (PgdA/CDA1 family) [Paenibacillus methanolicus]